MPWKIARWQGTTKVQEYTIDTLTSREEMTRKLEQLAAEHLQDAQSAHARGVINARDSHITVRSNRDGTMLWTTDKDHFIAKKVSAFTHGIPARSVRQRN